MGQSKLDTPEKLAIMQGTHGEEKQNKNTTQLCVGRHYAQTNTNNINKT